MNFVRLKSTRNKVYPVIIYLLLWGAVLFSTRAEGAEIYLGKMKNIFFIDGQIGGAHTSALNISAQGTVSLFKGPFIGIGPSLDYNLWGPEWARLWGTSDTTRIFERNGQVLSLGLRIFPALWKPYESLIRYDKESGLPEYSLLFVSSRTSVWGLAYFEWFGGIGAYFDPDSPPWRNGWQGEPFKPVGITYLSLGAASPYILPLGLRLRVGWLKPLYPIEPFNFFASLTAGVTYLAGERFAPPPNVRIKSNVAYSNNKHHLSKDNTATITLKLYNAGNGPAKKVSVTPRIPCGIDTNALYLEPFINPIDSTEYTIFLKGNPFLPTDTHTCVFKVAYLDDMGEKYADSISVNLVTHADTSPSPIVDTTQKDSFLSFEIEFPKGLKSPDSRSVPKLDSLVNQLRQFPSTHVILRASSYGAIYGGLRCPICGTRPDSIGARYCHKCNAELRRERIDNFTYHMNLARLRAEYVKRYLVSRGVASSRIQIGLLGNTVQKNAVEINQVE
ncbi:hypothetical protein KAX06_01510 [candidate division WOR-3 bacterium]|nr:hypothetical protein [candidate division WOR-3 bacterium]